jgi:hypothetical protein
MFAQRYLNHKAKSNIINYDVFFLEKARLYRLDEQYEIDGDVVMIDPKEDRNYNYYEMEIQNKSLSEIYINIKNSLKDNNIIIHLFSNI